MEKAGYDAVMRGPSAIPAQATANGDAIAYLSYGGFPTALGNTATYAGHVSARGSDGWHTTELTPKRTAITTPSAAYEVFYDAFSEDLSKAVLDVPGQLLTPDATPGVFNLFLRQLDGSYSWINSATPAELPPQGPQQCKENCYHYYDVPAFAGASSDFRRIIFESNGKLTPEAPTLSLEVEEAEEEQQIQNLYENAEGQIHLVGILPDGTPAAQGATAGGRSSAFYVNTANNDRRVEHAISADGSHVIFQAAADEGTPAEAGQIGLTELYDRIAGKETLELSAPAAGGGKKNGAPGPAQFWAASGDGSRVFFTSAAELTAQANTGEANASEALYEYNLGSKTVTDLTLDSTLQDSTAGPRVLGVVGASSDGQYVYFVAEGQLVAGQGVDGAPNLYVEHDDGRPSFIATLSSSDSQDWTIYPTKLEAYVTPDGAHLGFTSSARLTTTNFPSGYDNTDQVTGQPDSEVYEYSAPTAAEEAEGDPGSLACGSCDPTGAQPRGNSVIAGSAPEAEGVSGNTPFYHVRALSENGARLFFTASTVSVEHSAISGSQTPQAKVYEYEREEEGSCRRAHGCVFLLSNAANSSDDVFLDASASGDDVFLGSAGRLTTSDNDTLLDVYDARVGGTVALPNGESKCQGDCRQAGGLPAGQPVFTGASGPSGNLAPSSHPARLSKQLKRRPGGLTSSQKLGKALKKCRKDKNKRQRDLCDRRARRGYHSYSKAKPQVTATKTTRRIAQ